MDNKILVVFVSTSVFATFLFLVVCENAHVWIVITFNLRHPHMLRDESYYLTLQFYDRFRFSDANCIALLQNIIFTGLWQH